MSLPKLHILVVDREYLVAMEAERILTEGLHCDVEIASPRYFPDVLNQRSFELLIIDSGLISDEWRVLIREQHLKRTPIILTTLGNELRQELQEFSNFPVVYKPFNDDELREAARHALASRAVGT